jgi:hypothetical protein
MKLNKRVKNDVRSRRIFKYVTLGHEFKKTMVAIQDELKKIEDIIIQDNLFIKIYTSFCKINKLCYALIT